MKKLCLFLLLITSLGFSQSGIPKSGTYHYTILFAEWNNSRGPDCKVIIDGNKIKIIHNGGNVSGKKGDIIEEGVLLKHKSGVWIIGRNENDKNADEIGGCTDGPRVIDFKNKTVTLC